ncbi:hypothetical protein EJ110_NYTH12114 [Nymphaea thermarum]|nr:hypothetical protein EJ110_NYTH12114 [Nymphaea thermarum]
MKGKKDTVAYIAKDSVRKATFKKRKKGLLKKLSELSILCGVIASAIIFGENDMLPEIWPNIEKAQQGIHKYKELIEVDRIKLLMNAEGFLQERIEKLKKQHAKLSKENQDLESTLKLVESMHNTELLLEASIEDVRALSRVVAVKHAMVQTRKKVKLAYIPNDSIRRATFRKRQKGLLKKLSELTILCGARSCAIFFGENRCPSIWPSDAQEVRRIVDDLNGLSEIERAKRTTDEEGFLRQQIDKLRGQLHKLRKANSEEELKHKLIEATTNRETLCEVRIEEVQALKSMVDAKSAIVRAWCDSSRPQLVQPHSPSPPPPPPPLPPPPPSLSVVDHLHGHQWFNHFVNFPDCFFPECPNIDRSTSFVGGLIVCAIIFRENDILPKIWPNFENF